MRHSPEGIGLGGLNLTVLWLLGSRGQDFGQIKIGVTRRHGVVQFCESLVLLDCEHCFAHQWGVIRCGSGDFDAKLYAYWERECSGRHRSAITWRILVQSIIGELSTAKWIPSHCRKECDEKASEPRARAALA